MPRRGGRRKKTRTHVVENVKVQSALASSDLKVPRSLVIRRGKVESEVLDLVSDLRHLMLPYTALHFKEDAKSGKSTTLSHYSKQLALPMGISHILAFSQKKERLHLRLAKTPAGPTMSFRVHRFSLTRHVRAIQRRPYSSEAAFAHAPIVVTNNFGGADAPPHVKLMRITFQNMFPAINVASVKLKDCRRVVLFHLIEQKKQDEETGRQMVQVRHYAIKATPVGVNRKVRRLVQTKIPNLSRLDDIADYITGTTREGDAAPSAVAGGNASDSEPEDETSHVVLPQSYSGRGNQKHQKSALKLVELGPRLSLELVKVERDLGGGDVMYHAHVQKSEDEVREIKEKHEQEAQLKQARREEQQRNVERKRKAKEDKLARKKQRREDRQEATMSALRGEQRRQPESAQDRVSEEEESIAKSDDVDENVESEGDTDSA